MVVKYLLPTHTHPPAYISHPLLLTPPTLLHLPPPPSYTSSYPLLSIPLTPPLYTLSPPPPYIFPPPPYCTSPPPPYCTSPPRFPPSYTSSFLHLPPSFLYLPLLTSYTTPPHLPTLHHLPPPLLATPPYPTPPNYPAPLVTIPQTSKPGSSPGFIQSGKAMVSLHRGLSDKC